MGLDVRKRILFCFVLLLNSCTNTPSPPSPTLPAPPLDATATFESPVEVLPVSTNTKTYKIAVSPPYPPYEYINEQGQLAGFDVDIINAIAFEAGINITLVETRFDTMLDDVSVGLFDAGISYIDITPERSKVVLFSDPYLYSGNDAIIYPKNTNFKVEDLSSLASLRVGVASSSWYIDTVKQVTDVKMVTYDDLFQALNGMARGEVDAVVDELSVSQFTLANHPEWNFNIFVYTYNLVPSGIVINPADFALQEKINFGLRGVIKNGKYSEIYEKWFGVLPSKEFLPE